MRGRFALRVLFAAVLCTGGPLPLRQSVTGSIQASSSINPARCARCEVNVSKTATGAIRTTTTDTTGSFRAALLPVGPYKLSASCRIRVKEQSGIT